MKMVSKSKKLLWAVGFSAVVCSFLWALIKLENTYHPITTQEAAIQMAVAFLKRESINVDPATANVIFLFGKWNVNFFVNPSVRPASILIRINPITGSAEMVHLK